MACGILVPRQGIEPVLPAVEASSLTTGSPGKSSIANVYAPKMILLSKREISVWSPVRRGKPHWLHTFCVPGRGLRACFGHELAFLTGL